MFSLEKRFLNLKYHTYGLIVGWLSLIASFVVTIGGLCNAIIFGYNDNMQQFESTNDKFFIYPDLETIRSYQKQRDDFVSSSIFNSVLSGIFFICSLFLIIGLIKKRHEFIMPWLANTCLYIIFVGFLIVMLLESTLKSLMSGRTAFDFQIYLIIFMIIFFVSSLIWKFVFNLFHVIRSERKEFVLSQKKSDKKMLI